MSQADEVRKLDSILGIWAHPDDEAWSSAGLMRMAVLNGQRVGIITATRGSAGKTADESRWPSEKLSKIREQEMKACLTCIGNIEHMWLDYKDGTLIDQDKEKAVQKLVKEIKKFQPNTIVTFAADGMTGHDDHRTISAWVDNAVRDFKDIVVLHAVQSKKQHEKGGKKLDDLFNVFFAVQQPNIVDDGSADLNLELDNEVLQCKLDCLRAHHSQTEHIFNHPEGKRAFEATISCECYVKKH